MTRPDPDHRVASCRSALFVPATRPDRFDRATRSGADLVLLDLEDAVAPVDKVAARESAAQWLRSGGMAAIRINPRGTPWFEEDLKMAARVGAPVLVPKVEGPEDVEAVRRVLGSNAPIIGLVETARGIIQAVHIALAGGLSRIAFGNIDLAAEIGVDPQDRAALAMARSAVVIASAAAGIPPPLDGVTTKIEAEVARDDASLAHSAGFGGKLCIHPVQVPVVNGAFLPSAAEVEAATVIVSTYNGGVMVIAGRMVDEPVAVRARRTLERASFDPSR